MTSAKGLELFSALSMSAEFRIGARFLMASRGQFSSASYFKHTHVCPRGGKHVGILPKWVSVMKT